jgi:hypothetical protein
MSPDRKSFLFAALVGANTHNYFSINRSIAPSTHANFHQPPASSNDFRSAYGVSAQAYPMNFSASGVPYVKSVAAALRNDPGFPKIVAEPGEFLKLRLPARNGVIKLLECQACDVDLRDTYAAGDVDPPVGAQIPQASIETAVPAAEPAKQP